MRRLVHLAIHYRRAVAGDRAARRAKPATRSDNLVLSFPKCGRTWLAYLYAYYACYSIAGDRADEFIDHEITPTAHVYRPLEHPAFLALLEGDRGRSVTPVRVAHLYDPVPYFQLDVELPKLEARHVVFLVRDPRDVVVSYFHHTTRRARQLPGRSEPAPDVDLPEFLRSDAFGIRAIVAYMNQVVERGPAVFTRFHMVHYEDLVAKTAAAFEDVLHFFGTDVKSDLVERAVQRASFARLRRIEINHRMKKLGAEPPGDALRFRRGIPGGYRAELSDSDIAYLDRVIERHLTPALARYRQ